MKVMDRIAIGAGGVLALILALAGFAAIGGTQDGIEGGIGLAVILVIYVYPTVHAYRRHVPNTGSVAVVNVLLGWTIIGWIVALAMAMRDPRPAP